MTDWYWECIKGHFSAQTVWERLFATAPISTVLEDCSNFSIVAGNPLQTWQPSLGSVLDCLGQVLVGQALVQQALVRQAHQTGVVPNYLPFTGGYLGWFGYDLAWEIENLPYLKQDDLPFPVAFWYEPQEFIVIDHQRRELWLATTNPQALPELVTKIQQPLNLEFPPAECGEITFIPDRSAFCRMVEIAKQHIAKGDIFQANLSVRFTTTYGGSGWQIYRRLHQINPSPFACYWRTPWGEIISCSPERLLRIRDNIAETRPIAGTVPKTADPQFDAQALLNSCKDVAEHIMLVDLERNDLGKVCRWGTVEVNELLVQEYYSHVVHLVSNVRGEIRPECSWVDVVKAVFPGGTITGCPKVRAMEIIETLEPQRRSLFYGSCGYLDRRGYLDLNILIRTMLKHNDRVWGQVGAGIVADSDPPKEWLESLQKAKAQISALHCSLLPHHGISR
ncbi:MAG: anthranilate synthase component I [Pseudanabaenaceae cyanobacterium SKYGB_i_bin29]|nr:anthranilate synthase component I [Pseudanabaenaceae cyanobacterium SKYG29]MDW8420241.1 anthranilate synthase component I [Pseudanabaenaceae cyanobacterium SKYGB_i_bin29]